MKFLLLFLDFVLCCVVCKAQKPIPSRLDPRNYPNGVAMINDSELVTFGSDISAYDTLDTARYMATYDFTYPSNVRFSDPPLTDRMTLEIGNRKTAFYSLDLFKDDSLYTYRWRQSGRAGNFNSNHVRFLVYGDRQSQELEVQQRMPMQSGRVVTIPGEAIPQWTIDTLACEMLGYRCLRATTHYGGRDWTVWFTLEIPFSVGPWKLWGLPGLVLRAEEAQGMFSFICTSVMVAERPIRRYRWRSGKPIDHDVWLKLEERMHRSPYAMFGQDTQIVSIGNSPGFMDENWEVPYCPLELE